MHEPVLILSASKWEREGKTGLKLSYLPQGDPLTGDTQGVFTCDASLPVEQAVNLKAVPGYYELASVSGVSTDRNGRRIQTIKPAAIVRFLGPMNCFAQLKVGGPGTPGGGS